MANDLTPLSTASMPLTLDQRLYVALGTLDTGRREGGTMILTEKLSPELRALFVARNRDLHHWLEPGSKSEISKAISAMILGLNVYGQAMTEREAAAVLSQYVKVIQKMPVWAVLLACNKFETGNVTEDECATWDRSRRPTTAEVYKVVESIVRPWHAESHLIFKMLRGVADRPVNEEMRLRIGDLFRGLLENLKSGAAERRRVIIENYNKKDPARTERQIREHWRAKGKEPPEGYLVSPSLVENLKDRRTRDVALGERDPLSQESR